MFKNLEKKLHAGVGMRLTSCRRNCCAAVAPVCLSVETSPRRDEHRLRRTTRSAPTPTCFANDEGGVSQHERAQTRFVLMMRARLPTRSYNFCVNPRPPLRVRALTRRSAISRRIYVLCRARICFVDSTTLRATRQNIESVTPFTVCLTGVFSRSLCFIYISVGGRQVRLIIA